MRRIPTRRDGGLFTSLPVQSLRALNTDSIVHGGVHFVHMVRAETVADSNGRLSLPIWPMLRFVSADGDVCHFADPMIEGQLIGFDKGAGFERNRTKPLSFTIQERK